MSTNRYSSPCYFYNIFPQLCFMFSSKLLCTHLAIINYLEHIHNMQVPTECSQQKQWPQAQDEKSAWSPFSTSFFLITLTTVVCSNGEKKVSFPFLRFFCYCFSSCSINFLKLNFMSPPQITPHIQVGSDIHFITISTAVLSSACKIKCDFHSFLLFCYFSRTV